MNFFVKNFLRGLAIVVPMVVTIYIVWLIYQMFARFDELLDVRIPGTGLMLTLLVILAVGVLASNIVGRKLLELTETLFVKAPIVKIVYLSIKDLTQAFVGEKKKFDRPVVVAFGEGMTAKALGFITREEIDIPGLSDHVMVYFPQSYNFAGNLFLVPRAAVQPIAADSSQVMALIVSGGISGAVRTEAHARPAEETR